MKNEAEADSTEKDRRGEVLCIASAKGGSGKTLISATIAYLLARSGRKVVTIDCDFSTRGLSLYLLGETVRNKELKIPKENCLADAFMDASGVEKVQPRRTHLGATVYNIVFSNCELWRSGVPDDRLLGVDQGQWQDRGGVASYLHFLADLCDRFRREYDHVVIDTRGGYDYSTAVPALLADGYVIVMEADSVSLNQVFGFMKSIDNFAEKHERRAALRGVIVNKAPFSPGNKLLLDTLSNILGLKTYGVIPADIRAIEVYQKNRIPSDIYPESDFAYFSLKVFRNLMAPAENWTKGEAIGCAEHFRLVSEKIEKRWTVRRIFDNLQRRIPFAQIAVALLVVSSYLIFARGLLAPTVPLVLLTLYVAIGIVTDTLRSLRSPPLVKWKRGFRGMALVLMLLLWLMMLAFPLADLMAPSGNLTVVSNVAPPDDPRVFLLQIKMSFEGDTATTVRIDFERDNRPVRTVDVAPRTGLYSIDVRDMPSGEYQVFFYADGFAAQWERLSIEGGIPRHKDIAVNLYKRRYVVLTTVVNQRGKNLFDADDGTLRRERAAYVHWSAPVHDWQIWQGGREGELFGDTLNISYLIHGFDNGAIRMESGTNFDSVVEAPASGYETGTFLIQEGEVYVFRTANGLYGKVLIGKISETRPEDAPLITPRGTMKGASRGISV